MEHLDIINHVDHAVVTEHVRKNLATRLTRLLDAFEMFLEDDPREFTPGQIQNYLAAVKLLAVLYQAHQPPVDDTRMIPADRVEKMLEAARIEAAREAVEAERARMALESRAALESGASRVRSELARERDRQSRALG